MIDYHIHTEFSGDCSVPMRRMARAARDKGIAELCFTDHIDIDSPGQASFVVDMPAYISGFESVAGDFPGLTMRLGIEAGLDLNTIKRMQTMLENQPLDYVIGSQHMVFGLDPYYNTLWERYTQQEVYEEYIRTVMECACACDFYDVLGHLGYIGKFCPYEDKLFRYSVYSDGVDALLKALIERGKGLEVNTNGLFMTPDTMPERPIIQRFFELGGEIVTIGSDAHRESVVGHAVPEALATLKSIGFKYVCAFDARKPRFIPIP